MKNHILVNGRLLQTNKKWAQLGGKPKSYIRQVTMEAHTGFVKEHNQLPRGKYKAAIFDLVKAKVIEREIWLPEHELKFNVYKLLDRLNRKRVTTSRF